MYNINSALKICYKYKHSFSNKNYKCSNFPFLLENVVETDFENPYVLYLEVTSLCNLRCKHCFFGYDEKNYSANDDMSVEEIKFLIDSLVQQNEICAVNIMGKEPFMRKDIIEIIKYIKNYNLYLKIQTNGTLIDKTMFNNLSNILDKQNDVLHISIDGATEEVHDNIRGKGNFEKTKKAIKLFTQNGYNVLLAYTVNSINVSSIPYLAELCSELDVKNVLIGLYEDYIEPIKYLIPSTDDVIINCANLLNKNKKLTKKVYYDLAFLSPDFMLNYEIGEKILDEYIKEYKNINNINFKCHKSERISIMSNGDVYLCPSCQTTNKEFCLGNIRRQALSEIWSKRYENVFFQSRVFKKSLCKICKYKNICKGGCMVSSQFTYGTTDAKSARCEYYKKLEKIYVK